MGVPGWLLNIVASFLEDRELLLRYQGYTAKSRKLPGGGPQGTVLGMFLFIVLINMIGFKDQEKQIGKIITKPLNKRKPMKNIHLKFVDDMTVAESLNLKKQLVPNPNINQGRPLEYHNRTEQSLPESVSQIVPLLNDILDYTNNHKMKINSDKSKVMLFNTARKNDFQPQLYLDSSDYLSLVENTTLLGVEIQSNLRWNLNTDYICTIAYSRIWMLRRLKAHGATTSELVDVYAKQVRCVLELAVAVWSPGITAGQVTQIERVQKTACAVILGDSYLQYSNALTMLNLKSLKERRMDLCLKFAKNCVKSDKFSHWFIKRSSDPAGIQTRRVKTDLIPVDSRTKRFSKSPLPYLTSLLNEAGK